jgi:hypothetical protein
MTILKRVPVDPHERDWLTRITHVATLASESPRKMSPFPQPGSAGYLLIRRPTTASPFPSVQLLSQKISIYPLPLNAEFELNRKRQEILSNIVDRRSISSVYLNL